ncbi:hypothetical protein E2C01_055367 [Portunus trituberculatus]|uniref:Uncharacterized protein n=1 Tax=Portunus trituberculatus TaxID=210409 RepID=A0A5B7GWL7_PORTR|nr:hypothetical protein [Portunus trituberculatus]
MTSLSQLVVPIKFSCLPIKKLLYHGMCSVGGGKSKMSAGGGGSLQDRTLNKVALCSAVFAGFAYVGYSYAKTAFCRKLARRHDLYDEESEVSRVVFRRLSQTTQTDALLGNLDVSNARGKLIIRPKTVQVRHLVIISLSDPS